MADVEKGTGLVTREERPISCQTELQAMSREQLQAELDKALADLADNEELRSGFLGQTGVHIRSRVLKSARRQFEQEEARLKERIAILEGLLGPSSSEHRTRRDETWTERPS